MSRLFDERAHTAENIYVHDEELRFLAHRRAIEALGAWATEAVAMNGEAAARYRTSLVDAFVSGTPEDRIITRVQTDLEHAGKPALSTTAITYHAQALAHHRRATRSHRAANAARRAGPNLPPPRRVARLARLRPGSS